MADEDLEWELKIKDYMSGPMDKIEAKMASFEKALGGLGSASDRAAKGLGKGLSSGGIDKALGLAKAKIVGARGDFAQAWRGLMAFTGPATDRVSSVLAPVFGKMLGGLSKGGGMLSGAVGRMLSPMWGPLSGMLSKVGGKLAGFGRSALSVLGPLGAGFGKIGGAAFDMAKALGGKLGPAFKALGGAGMAGASFLAGTALAIGAGAVAIGAAAGKWAISGLQFKEDTLSAFRTMLGTQAAADRVFKQATKFAASTPFSTEEVVSGYQGFLTAGFKEDELDKLMRAAGDVGANMGTERMSQVIRALGQIRSTGKLQGDELVQLSDAGVSRGAVYEALSKSLGGGSNAQIEAMISGGRVTSSQGIDAILEAIRTTQSGGKLGSAMEGKSKTLTGLFSSLMDIPSTLLFGSDALKALDPLKSMVKSVLDMFEEGRPLFKQGTAMFDRVASAWGKAFGSMGNANVEGLLSSIMTGIEKFGVAAAPFASGFFTEVMNQLGSFFGAFSDPNASPEELQKKGQELGQALGMILKVTAAVGWLMLEFAEGIYAVGDALGTGLARVFGGGGASDEEDAASEAAWKKEMDNLRAYKAARGGGDLAAGGAAAGAPPNVTTTVGNITVQVAPGEERAGLKIASQIQGQMPATLSNYATEMGG